MVDIDERLKAIEDNIQSIECTVNSLVQQVSKGFESINGKIDTLRTDSNMSFEKVDTTMEEVLEALKKLDVVTRYEEEYKDLEKFGRA